MNDFEQAYFSHGNYTYYTERRDRYVKTAQELASFFVRTGLLAPPQRVLDFGCAMGFLVAALRDSGFDCQGYDISDWAASEARKLGVEIIPKAPAEFDMMIALDVLEHMRDEQIAEALDLFRSPYLLVRIPVSTDGGKTFHLKISQNDPSHVNCLTKEGWYSLLRHLGFPFVSTLGLYTIYDTPGVLCGLFSRQPLTLR
jgi:cyclopropane fatty-acyl-phospholipid synthase-like methyltransferase